MLVRVWRILGELTAEQVAFTEKVRKRGFCEETKISLFAYFPELPDNIVYSAFELTL